MRRGIPSGSLVSMELFARDGGCTNNQGGVGSLDNNRKPGSNNGEQTAGKMFVTFSPDACVYFRGG